VVGEVVTGEPGEGGDVRKRVYIAGPISKGDLAHNINQATAAFVALAKAGLVSSVRGAQGGYRLARPAGEITSGEILRAVEGELTAIPCLASSVDCPHRSQCHTLDFWSGLNDLINKYVDGITLEQLRTMPEVPEEQESCE
jgi:Rrf2 family protein